MNGRSMALIAIVRARSGDNGFFPEGELMIWVLVKQIDGERALQRGIVKINAGDFSVFSDVSFD